VWVSVICNTLAGSDRIRVRPPSLQWYRGMHVLCAIEALHPQGGNGSERQGTPKTGQTTYHDVEALHLTLLHSFGVFGVYIRCDVGWFTCSGGMVVMVMVVVMLSLWRSGEAPWHGPHALPPSLRGMLSCHHESSAGIIQEGGETRF
jgi:hypothetical protein